MLRLVTALFLIGVPIAFSLCFSLLQQLFEYPAILRQPTSDVLRKFADGGAPLIVVWYALTLTAVGFIPLSVLVHRLVGSRGRSTLLSLATTFGIIAGVAQTLGFLRWPFVVPHLAQAYVAPGASDAQRAVAVLIFEAFHRYAGVAIGEHLGYLSTSAWTILIAIVLLRTGLLPRWLAVAGGVLGIGIAAGLLEPAGWTPGAAINAVSYLLWAAWLVAVGVTLLVRQPRPYHADESSLASAAVA